MDALSWAIDYAYTNGLHPRRCLILKLQNPLGGQGYGEIAPLPGHSKESLDEAEEQLRAHLQKPLKCLFPSVEFGYLSALCDLHSPLPSIDCPTHAFLTGSFDAILSRADEMYKRGFRLAKLKLSGKNSEEAHALITALKDRFRLRLDFNRGFTQEQALDFFSKYDKSSFDYIEEPLKEVAELFDFPLPFALDETLREPFNEKLLLLPTCAALILKPTLLGDITPFLKMHKRCILSPCFEGPVGIGQIAKLAKRHNLMDETHGLDTLSN